MTEEKKDKDPTGPCDPYEHEDARLKKLALPFDPKEIDWRIGQAGSKDGKPWAKVLAYIDSRAVMDRLDEVVGAGNWKDRYWREGTGVMCGLSVRVRGEWVEKVDGSEETDIEAYKGGISKALVRTAVKWGIGRYLYNVGDGWANIVAGGTPGARWQGAKVDGKHANQNYPAFNWLPPELPSWAIPPKDPSPKPPGGPGPAGKPLGSGGNSVAEKTAQAQAAVRNRIAGPAPAERSQARAGEAAPRKPERSEAGDGPSEGHDLTEFDDPYSFFNAPTPELRGAAIQPHGEVQERVLHERPAPGAQGQAAEPRGADRESSPVAAKPSHAHRASGPGAGPVGKPAPGAHAEQSIPGSVGAKQPDQQQQDRPAQRAVPDGKANEPVRQERDSSPSVGGSVAQRLPGEVPAGAGQAAPKGSAEQSAKPKRATARVTPKTQDEIDWFVGNMKDELSQVKSMPQLERLWKENVVLVASLPEKYRAQVIEEKDNVKKKFAS